MLYAAINVLPLNEVARISAYFEIVVWDRLDVQYQTCKEINQMRNFAKF